MKGAVPQVAEDNTAARRLYLQAGFAPPPAEESKALAGAIRAREGDEGGVLLIKRL